ncbi:hypothetical protein, partial [Streptomyces flaveus]|uniref:hypothetical protein n=1 Tax=Streptomyces flaveus TaxID=66370 RepID=UPI001BC95B0C
EKPQFGVRDPSAAETEQGRREGSPRDRSHQRTGGKNPGDRAHPLATVPLMKRAHMTTTPESVPAR